MKGKIQEEPSLTLEQQQTVDDGLRILARMIARRFIQDSTAADGDATSRLTRTVSPVQEMEVTSEFPGQPQQAGTHQDHCLLCAA